MEKNQKYIVFGAVLIILSAIIYYFHYLIFHDPHHIFIYLLGDIAFVPMEVLLISMIIHHFLNDMDKKHRFEKLNMLIGVFFSEVGTNLLEFISDADPELDSHREKFIVEADWSDKDFDNLIKSMNKMVYNVDTEKIDFEHLSALLVGKREFLVRMLENPTMFEHEEFTELLRAVFHLTEELDCRNEFSCLPTTDTHHLTGDITRVYALLTREWLSYMKHTKKNYPYLFSLAIRTNPFDTESTPIVT
ncbi:hypothetical protein [Methanolobus sp. ZRKC5]|uniref:hypothetical protein n=1 Tax=unclassified Methanolobus TaxID=2629569 RepID=UPI00313DFB69